MFPVGAEDKLVASDEWGYDIFGFSAAIDGDTTVIGAPGNDDDDANSGSAYIFQWDSTTDTWSVVTRRYSVSSGLSGKGFW